jgi:hypothetical protein
VNESLHTIGATVEVVIPREWLENEDYMDSVITTAVRTFRDKFIMAAEAAEDNPDGVFDAVVGFPL